MSPAISKSLISARAAHLQKMWHYLREAIAYRDCAKFAAKRGDVDWAARYRRNMRLMAGLYRQEAGLVTHD